MSTHVEVAATTASERAVRIQHLAQSDRDAVQAILEAGAKAIIEGHGTDGEGHGFTPGSRVHGLAQLIVNTFEPEAPEYAEGDRVAVANGTVGKVVEYHLDERGEWEYRVRFGGSGTAVQSYPYREHELRPAEEVA